MIVHSSSPRAESFLKDFEDCNGHAKSFCDSKAIWRPLASHSPLVRGVSAPLWIAATDRSEAGDSAFAPRILWRFDSENATLLERNGRSRTIVGER